MLPLRKKNDTHSVISGEADRLNIGSEIWNVLSKERILVGMSEVGTPGWNLT